MSILYLLLLLLITAVIFYGLAFTSFKPHYAGKVHVDTLITVKDAEDSIECIIKEMSRRRGSEQGCIYVINVGSSDKTVDILSRLERDMPYLHHLSVQKAEAIINDIGFVE